MSDTAITGQRKTSIGWLLPVAVSGGGPEIDLTLPGTRLDVTVKRRRTDAVPLIVKSWDAVGGPAGITLQVEAPPAVTNTAVVDLAPADTDPAAYPDGSFADTEFLVWDAILTEPGGRKTVVAKGALTVTAGVGS